MLSLALRFARRLALLGVVFWLSAGCIDPVDLDVPVERQLVVDGLVTDLPPPYTLRLSQSSAFQRGADAIDLPVEGAVVRVEDDEGTTFFFDETGTRGVYRSAADGPRGAVGRTYTLTVELPDGRVFTSEPERMRPVPPIRSLTTRVQQDVTGSFFEVAVALDDPGDERNYYRWRPARTVWQLQRDCSPGGEVWSENSTCGSVDPPCCTTCWVCGSGAPNDNLVFTEDDQLFNGQTYSQPVFRVEPDTRLVNGYSVEIQQLSLSPRAHAFWRQIRQQQDLDGSVFAPIPAPVPGNVARADDRETTALGYFGVSAVAGRRVCITPGDYGGDRPVFPYRKWRQTCQSFGPNSFTQKPDFWDCTSTPQDGPDQPGAGCGTLEYVTQDGVTASFRACVN